MFLMIGVNEKREEIDYDRTVICSACGAYGRYIVFMTCTVLSLFFIPIFKWNRKYYVQSRCCGTIFMLDPEIGKRIRAGEDIEIRNEHLTQLGRERCGKRCRVCGFMTEEDFDFCPKCGNRF